MRRARRRRRTPTGTSAASPNGIRRRCEPPRPAKRRAVRGKCGVNRIVAGACLAKQGSSEKPSSIFWWSRLRKERGMRYIPTTFEKLLEPLNRRQFEAIVERYRGDAYAKTFDSW